MRVGLQISGIGEGRIRHGAIRIEGIEEARGRVDSMSKEGSSCPDNPASQDGKGLNSDVLCSNGLQSRTQRGRESRLLIVSMLEEGGMGWRTEGRTGTVPRV